MAQTTDFEDVKAWDGVSGTGKDARGVLARNFQKIKNLFSSKADLVNGKVPTEQMSEVTVADGAVTPGKIASIVLQQEPDWTTILAKEGNWVIQDDSHATNRPSCLPEIAEGSPAITYIAIVVGKSVYTKGPRALIISENNDLYVTGLDDDSIMAGIKIAGPNELALMISAFNAALTNKLSVFENTDLLPEDLDELTSPGEYKISMAVGAFVNDKSDFILKVSTTNNGEAIQRQIWRDQEWTRTLTEGGWSSWGRVNGLDPNYVELNVNFTTLEALVYNVPENLKFTSLESENSDPTLSSALGVDMARYSKLTITPTALGLVTLKGTLI